VLIYLDPSRADLPLHSSPSPTGLTFLQRLPCSRLGLAKPFLRHPITYHPNSPTSSLNVCCGKCTHNTHTHTHAHTRTHTHTHTHTCTHTHTLHTHMHTQHTAHTHTAQHTDTHILHTHTAHTHTHTHTHTHCTHTHTHTHTHARKYVVQTIL